MHISTLLSKKTLTLGVFFVLLILIDYYLKNYYFRDIIFCNTNISLNININIFFYWAIWLIINILLIIQLLKSSTKSILFQFSLIIVIAGSLINIYDRYMFGCIRDYIAFFYNNLFFYNIADLYIFIGLITYLYLLFRKT